MSIDHDEEKLLRPLALRERIVLRLVLFVIALIAPAKYSHQLKPWLEGIDK